VAAPYAAGSLTFIKDGSAAGRYTIAAPSGALTKPSSLLTVTTGANAPVAFTFP
jgi:hypothetical protein